MIIKKKVDLLKYKIRKLVKVKNIKENKRLNLKNRSYKTRVQNLVNKCIEQKFITKKIHSSIAKYGKRVYTSAQVSKIISKLMKKYTIKLD